MDRYKGIAFLCAGFAELRPNCFLVDNEPFKIDSRELTGDDLSRC